MPQSSPNSVELALGSALLSRVDEPFRVSAQTLSLANINTVADVLAHIGLNPDAMLLIVLNDTMVPRTGVLTQTLTNGDRLSLMPPIHAG